MSLALQSTHYDLDDCFALQKFYHSRGWTDGFPIVPPTPDAVQACLDWVNMPGTELIGIEPVREQFLLYGATANTGAIDRSTLGHPGKISYCLAESEEGSDWSSLATLRDIPAGASAVTVRLWTR